MLKISDSECLGLGNVAKEEIEGEPKGEEEIRGHFLLNMIWLLQHEFRYGYLDKPTQVQFTKNSSIDGGRSYQNTTPNYWGAIASC